MVSLIAAVAENGVIGDSNKIPWYLPADLRHFKEITLGHTVVMGRKTYQSIVERLGKPLPDRRNIVLTRQSNFKAPGCEVFSDLNEVLDKLPGQDIFIIGGAEVYQVSIPIADKLYITRVHSSPEGDRRFPNFNDSDWKLVHSDPFEADEKNPVPYTFLEYERIK